MTLDATLQIRINSQDKEAVEALYKEMGTTFAEAVRIFAKQSIRMTGMPFTPDLNTYDEMTPAEIDERIARGMSDVAAGRVYAAEDVNKIMEERYTAK